MPVGSADGDALGSTCVLPNLVGVNVGVLVGGLVGCLVGDSLIGNWGGDSVVGADVGCTKKLSTLAAVGVLVGNAVEGEVGPEVGPGVRELVGGEWDL